MLHVVTVAGWTVVPCVAMSPLSWTLAGGPIADSGILLQQTGAPLSLLAYGLQQGEKFTMKELQDLCED
eukprot:7544574-Alexandrium_andersonii.AAC.1